MGQGASASDTVGSMGSGAAMGSAAGPYGAAAGAGLGLLTSLLKKKKTPLDISTGISSGLRAIQTRDALGNIVPEVAEVSDPNIQLLDRAAQSQGLINELRTRKYEREYNPDLAEAEKLTEAKTLADIKGEFDPGVKKLLMEAGVKSGLATGARPDATSFSANLTNMMTRGALALRDAAMTRATTLKAAKRQPVQGVDPSSVAQLLKNFGDASVNARNAYTTERTGDRSQRRSEFNALGQQIAGVLANEAGQNINMEAGTNAGQQSIMAGLLANAGKLASLYKPGKKTEVSLGGSSGTAHEFR